ncbi:MAG: hypothetical protein ACT4OX_01870 [Actinomycetota bacterium]
MSPKPSVVCPLCSLDDYLDYVPLADDVWEVTCSNSMHPEWVWSPTPEYPTGSIAEGIAADLDLFRKLPAVVSEDSFDEYGIVEYRFGIAHPSDYAELLALYGHRAQALRRPHTMSAFLARVLRQLQRDGDLDLMWGKGTGYWRYLDTVSYWTRDTTRPSTTNTWRDFAVANGLDPERWPLAGVEDDPEENSK